jgi:3-hydroxymyristoyl/3-hydroxydecanoyl-(acyl carrier protein) dehydratase
MGEKYQAAFSIPANHPALPGHFPGAPVVPGVVLLDLVLQASEAWHGNPVKASGLRYVKFHFSLLPEQRAEVMLELDGHRLAFRIAHGEQLIAQGVFDLELRFEE